jgi:hypothetical protein
LISSLKEQIMKAKASGVKDWDIERLWLQVEKIVKEKRDLLDGKIINAWNKK